MPIMGVVKSIPRVWQRMHHKHGRALKTVFDEFSINIYKVLLNRILNEILLCVVIMRIGRDEEISTCTQVGFQGAITFDRETTDPQLAIDWLRELSNAFRYLRPMPEKSVLYVAYLRRGATNEWWCNQLEVEDDPFRKE